MSFADEVYQPFAFVSEAAGGMPMDQVNFVVCQLSAYPLGLLFRMIPTSLPMLRHLLGIVVGLAYCVLCFREESVHLLFQALVTYFIVHYGGKHQHVIAMVFCMGHLTASNFYHRWYHWGEFALNINGPLMILVQKMTQLAFAVKDGKSANLDNMSANFKKQYAGMQVQPPTLLELLGHTFFFANVLCGPNHHFHEYKDFIEGVGKQATHKASGGETLDEIAYRLGCDADELAKKNDLSRSSKAKVKAGTVVKYTAAARGGIIEGLACLVTAFFWIAWNQGLPAMLVDKASAVSGVDGSAVADFLRGVAPKATKHQPVSGILTLSMVRLLVFQWLAMHLYRCTFYFAWFISEGANNVAGLGFKGVDKDGRSDWTGLRNISAYNVELADNLKCVLDNWNIQTQRWLVYVCYERLPPAYNTHATMLLSAVWHGPYLGYFMTFVTAAFVVEANRKVRRTIRPYFVPEGSKTSNRLYYVLGWLVTIVVLNYLVGPFVELTAENSILYWTHQYWFMHIGTVLVLVLFPGKPRAKKEATDADKKKSS